MSLTREMNDCMTHRSAQLSYYMKLIATKFSFQVCQSMIHFLRKSTQLLLGYRKSKHVKIKLTNQQYQWVLFYFPNSVNRNLQKNLYIDLEKGTQEWRRNNTSFRHSKIQTKELTTQLVNRVFHQVTLSLTSLIEALKYKAQGLKVN